MDTVNEPDDIFIEREQNHKSLDISIKIVKGDITQRQVDAIVNAAHEDLTGGGGVDGAIHRAAGQQLLNECMNLYGCPTGEARITNGYNLPAKYIIHTVGPVWNQNEKTRKLVELLSDCYKNCLNLAEMQGLKSIAFPCISTGAYCFPKDLAAEVAIHTIFQWFHRYIGHESNDQGTYLDLVEVVCFSDEDAALYEKVLKREETRVSYPKCHQPDRKKAVCSYIKDGLCHFGKECWQDRVTDDDEIIKGPSFNTEKQ